MIASIFSKSKPINFIIVFFITLLAFLLANLEDINKPIQLSNVLYLMVLFLASYISILMLDFIVSKNKLTQNNNYEILLYALFLVAIPLSLSSGNIIISNLFVLFGLRRLISLRTQKSMNKKLFDAAFWFAIAALFYFWSILFFVLILFTLLMYTDNKIKHWVIPFIGIATVFILAVSFSVLYYNNFFEVFKSLPITNLDFSTHNNLPFIIALTMLLSFGAWSSVFYIGEIKNKKKSFRPSFKIILFMVITSFAIVVLAPEKNGSEFLFLFSPLAIIITNYIETMEVNWFKDVFLAILVLVPFVLLFL
ncbi:DUF6427 family protein [Postechiella marina]|uniref:DUF6427 family protein n=1 Tax=Postechiella marina TaxID=943941 RepID=A0ABP8C646_9FLAO